MVKKMQYDQVKELISIFEKTDLSDMEVELDNAKVRLSRSGSSNWVQPVKKAPETPVWTPPEVNQEELPEESASFKTITAPIVGTFYQSSAPDQPPYVKVGDNVAAGDVVCIIEAMKFMNEVNSEVSGVIAEVLVEDGQFVEYGQELFRVK